MDFEANIIDTRPVTILATPCSTVERDPTESPPFRRIVKLIVGPAPRSLAED
jgi:hypothetical protein